MTVPWTPHDPATPDGARGPSLTLRPAGHGGSWGESAPRRDARGLSPQRERNEGQGDRDDPHHRPPGGADAHQVGSATGLWPHVIPATPSVVDSLDLVLTVRTDGVMLFDDRGRVRTGG